MPEFWIIKGVGDLTGVVGLAISIVGFFLAIREAKRAKTEAEGAKSAAVQAEAAAKKARDSINFFESIVDFSTGIANLEDIRRLHHQLPQQIPLLMDRYQSTRKLLVVLRHSNISLTDQQSAIIQNALANVVDMETQLQNNPNSFKAGKRNALVSADIDGLVSVLTQLKSQAGGVI